ncbi:TOG array regulator of axonemal microtubules protein 1 isoform X1 [Brevipalpus obovatus]|uniref:TOG array regulator of axonemal microtubules protein 1 isoform X1 n=1 Tax=Brevipalpus obovatus TaxID=246614 RepID=UPI003D9EA449
MAEPNLVPREGPSNHMPGAPGSKIPIRNSDMNNQQHHAGVGPSVSGGVGGANCDPKETNQSGQPTPANPRRPVTLHISSNGSSYGSELATLLRHLVDSGSKRGEILKELRRLIKRSEGRLPDVDRMQFFEAFYPMLADIRSKVVAETTMLIVDIIPQMGEHDLDPCMSIILPRVIPNLGHDGIEVRRASLRLLHVYMRYTNNLQKVLRMYIQYGLENHDKSAQKGCVLSLPLLFTEEFSRENLFPLVQSLGHLLVHSEANLFYPIFLAMQRLHSLVGNDTFRMYLQHLSPETVILYQKVLSRSSSTANSVARSDPHYGQSKLTNGHGTTAANSPSSEEQPRHQQSNVNDQQQQQSDVEYREENFASNRKARQDDGAARSFMEDEHGENVLQQQSTGQQHQQTNVSFDNQHQMDESISLSSNDTIPIDKIITTGDIPRNFQHLSPTQLAEAKRALIDSMILMQGTTAERSLGLEVEEDESKTDIDEPEVEQYQQQQQQQQQQPVMNQSSSNIEINQATLAMMMRMNDDFDRITQITTSNPDDTNSIGSEFNLAYGIFPLAVLNRALSDKMPDKIEGLMQMLNIMREAPTTHFSILVNYIPNFLSQTISPLVDHHNFKVTICGLEMLEVMVERLRLSAYPYSKQMIEIILKRLGDARALVREHDIKVTHRLMFHFPLQNVLNHLLEYKHHRNPKVREEIINRVTVALLMFPRSEFNLTRLSFEVASMLIDTKRSVRLAALESVAVIGHTLGPHRIISLLSTVQAIEQATQSDGLLNAVQARLARRDLPRCNPDGTLRYVLSVPPYSGWFPSTSEPDIEWILMASSSSCNGSGGGEASDKVPGNSSSQVQHHQINGHKTELKVHQQFSMEENIETNDEDSCMESDKSDNLMKPINQISRHFQKVENSQESHNVDGNGSFDEPRSPKSDDSNKSRELWRYYFMRFKQHLAEATCSSASSAISSRSKTADWIKRPLDYCYEVRDIRKTSFGDLDQIGLERGGRGGVMVGEQSADDVGVRRVGGGGGGRGGGEEKDEGKYKVASMRRKKGEMGGSSEDISGLRKGDAIIYETLRMAAGGGGIRDNRATSMPTLSSSDHLSDISEQSREDGEGGGGHFNPRKDISYPHQILRQRLQQAQYEAVHQPRSEPSSPPDQKMLVRRETDFEINFERLKSRMDGQSVGGIMCATTSSGQPPPFHHHRSSLEIIPNGTSTSVPLDVANNNCTAANNTNINYSNKRIPGAQQTTISSQAKSDPEIDHRTINENTIIIKDSGPPRRPSILPVVSVAGPNSETSERRPSKSHGKDGQSPSYQTISSPAIHDDLSRDVGHHHQSPSQQQQQRDQTIDTETKPSPVTLQVPIDHHPHPHAHHPDKVTFEMPTMNGTNEPGERSSEKEGFSSGDDEMIRTVEGEAGQGASESGSINSKTEDESCEDERNVNVKDVPAGEIIASNVPISGGDVDQDVDHTVADLVKPKSRTPAMKRKNLAAINKRLSRSISPPHTRQPQYQMIRIQPAIPPNANIRHIMENVVKTEGPFENPSEALRAAIGALKEEAWTTKVEGMLAITRLASFHSPVLQRELHNVVVSLVDEVKNLRSSVSRSAIFTLGDLFLKMKRSIESEMELIGSALINKCGENASFIREDCERAIQSMIDEMPQIKSALVLIHYGSNHRNTNVRRTSAYFISVLAEKMGSVKCLMGPRDIGENLLQAASKFLMDGSPHTRYYGRKIFSILMNNNLFDKLLRKHITPGMYRNICGILESIKRRGIGERPAD